LTSHGLLVPDLSMALFFYFAGLRKDDHDERSPKKTSHLLLMTRLSTPCFLLIRFMLWFACIWS